MAGYSRTGFQSESSEYLERRPATRWIRKDAAVYFNGVLIIVIIALGLAIGLRSCPTCDLLTTSGTTLSTTTAAPTDDPTDVVFLNKTLRRLKNSAIATKVGDGVPALQWEFLQNSPRGKNGSWWSVTGATRAEITVVVKVVGDASNTATLVLYDKTITRPCPGRCVLSGFTNITTYPSYYIAHIRAGRLIYGALIIYE